MKRPSLLLIIIVVGFCIGVAAIKLSGPVIDYAIARYLCSWGLDEASVEASYPQTGELVLRNVRLSEGPVVLKADLVRIKNPYYFIWGGPPPELSGDNLTLSLPLPDAVYKSDPAGDIFKNLKHIAEGFPFVNARFDSFYLNILADKNSARWKGRLRVESTEHFLTIQTKLENDAGQTLGAGIELSRLFPRGYLWWRYTPATPTKKGNWGGLAWDNAQITSFLRENASERTVLRADNPAQALAILRYTILTLAPPPSP